jgi:uncharacterized protein
MKPTTFVYMELRGEEKNIAEPFYSSLFGWEFSEIPALPVAYSAIHSAGERAGGMARNSGNVPHWLPFVGVSDVAAATAQARALGATIEVEPKVFGTLGTLSVIVDPAGARLALWEAASTEWVRNEWGVIVDHGNLIELQWLPSTSQMTDGGFMATLCLFVSVAERLRPRGLLIDATEFKHRFGPGVMEWRDAHIIPRYGSAGVRKFAFLMPAGFPRAGTEAFEGPAVFPTKWFVNRQEALDWLRAD